MGGSLADAVTCNAVVKSFGAEAREDARLGRVLSKWSRRTYRHWTNGTWSGTTQMIVLLGLRASVTSSAHLAVVARPCHAGRSHVRAHQLLHRSWISARCRPACGEPAAQRERDGRAGRDARAAVGRGRPAGCGAAPDRQRRGALRPHHLLLRRAATSRSSRTSRCALRRASAWAWWDTRAPAKRLS